LKTKGQAHRDSKTKGQHIKDSMTKGQNNRDLLTKGQGNRDSSMKRQDNKDSTAGKEHVPKDSTSNKTSTGIVVITSTLHISETKGTGTQNQALTERGIQGGRRRPQTARPAGGATPKLP
jgi:hypothetical protein